jgi:hypothetical protein
LNAITYNREARRRFLSMLSSNNMYSLAAGEREREREREREKKKLISKIGNF